MGIYNFSEQFIEPILTGQVHQTIRAPRSRQDDVGKIMALYTGLRQSWCRLLFRAPCTKVETILIWPEGEVWTCPAPPAYGVVSSELKRISIKRPLPGFALLSAEERAAFALADGFPHFRGFLDHWEKSLPFYGGIWKWDYSRRTGVSA